MQYPDSHPIQLQHNSAQLQGSRDRQEDTVAVFEPESGIFAVAIADGVGGQVLGDWASRTAVEIVAKASWLQPTVDPPAGRMKIAIEAAHTELQKPHLSSGRFPSTTLLLALMDLRAQKLTLASIGDSHAVLLRQGTLHSLLSTAYLDPNGMYEFRSRSLRYSVGHDIGFEGHGIEIQEYGLRIGDRLLFGTDGIEFASVDEIRRCQSLESPRAATEALLSLFLRGKDDNQDNVSFVVVHVEATSSLQNAGQ